MKKDWLSRIPWWWQRMFWSEQSEDVLSDKVNLRDLYFKYAVFSYFLIIVKINEVLEIVFDGYEADGNIFEPVEDRLEQLYRRLYRAMVELSNRDDFDMCNVDLLRSFSTLNGDFKQYISYWNKYKDQIVKDIDLLSTQYPKPYPPPHDLQVCFGELDILLNEHNQKKQTLLNKDKYIVLELGDLSLNKSTAQLTYKKTVVDIQLNRKEIKLLIELLKAKGGIVSYEELAKAIDIGAYTNQADSKELAINIQAIKRDLGNYLKDIGINQKSVDRIIDNIVAVKNQGYKLVS